MALALAGTVAAGVLVAWLQPLVAPVPALPPLVLLLALLLAGSGVVAAFGGLPRAAQWPATLVLPLCLWAIDFSARPELEPAALNIDLMAFRAVWAATIGGLVTALWLGVPLRHLVAFLAAAGLKAQLLAVGWQFVLPGMLLTVVLPLLEVVAARGEEGSWWRGALQATGRSPLAWVIALGGQVTALLLSTALLFAWGSEVAVTALLDPTTTTLPMRVVSELSFGLVSGGTLAFAASFYVPPR